MDLPWRTGAVMSEVAERALARAWTTLLFDREVTIAVTAPYLSAGRKDRT